MAEPIRFDNRVAIVTGAGAGTYEAAHVTLTDGAWSSTGADAAEQLRERLSEVTDRTSEIVPRGGEAQGTHEVTNAHAIDINAR